MTMNSKGQKPKACQTHVRVLLTDDEIQLPSLDDLINKCADWFNWYREASRGRKTRAANRRADAIFDELMTFKIPPPQAQPIPSTVVTVQENGNSSKSSFGGDSESSSVASSGLTGRVLRPRCRTPSVSRKQQETSPSTPTHQSIRAVLKKNPDSSSSNVLSAALNQQHPSVSVTKIRQLLRADSAQKRREEEKERQERVRIERKAKEERAEAQKRQLLEERAVTAKMKREQRLLHAAEVRKAREKAKIEQKLKEGLPVTKQVETKHQQAQLNHPPQQEPTRAQVTTSQPLKSREPDEALKKKADEQAIKNCDPPEAPKEKPVETQPAIKANRKLDETFQKPADEHNNIDISLHDETNEEPTKKVNEVASWAKAPLFRELVVAQFTKLDEQILAEALEIFGGVQLPVDLEQIFASHKVPANKRYLPRTSSAVWTPPHKPLKRSSSVVFTPTDQKR